MIVLGRMLYPGFVASRPGFKVDGKAPTLIDDRCFNLRRNLNLLLLHIILNNEKRTDVIVNPFSLVGDPYAIRTRECMRERHVS